MRGRCDRARLRGHEPAGPRADQLELVAGPRRRDLRGAVLSRPGHPHERGLLPARDRTLPPRLAARSRATEPVRRPHDGGVRGRRRDHRRAGAGRPRPHDRRAPASSTRIRSRASARTTGSTTRSTSAASARPSGTTASTPTGLHFGVGRNQIPQVEPVEGRCRLRVESIEIIPDSGGAGPVARRLGRPHDLPPPRGRGRERAHGPVPVASGRTARRVDREAGGVPARDAGRAPDLDPVEGRERPLRRRRRVRRRDVGRRRHRRPATVRTSRCATTSHGAVSPRRPRRSTGSAAASGAGPLGPETVYGVDL